MADKIMPLSEAVEGYDLFDKMKVQKGRTPQTPHWGVSSFVDTNCSNIRSPEVEFE